MKPSKRKKTKRIRRLNLLFRFIVLLFFSLWLLFWDSNSWRMHHRIDEETKRLNDLESQYNKSIESIQTQMDSLNNIEYLERYAREKYYMKQKGETIYILESSTDSTSNDQ